MNNKHIVNSRKAYEQRTRRKIVSLRLSFQEYKKILDATLENGMTTEDLRNTGKAKPIPSLFIKRVLMFFLENPPVILEKFKKDMADLRMEMRKKRTCRKIVSLSLSSQEYKKILAATLEDGMTTEDLRNTGKTKPIPSRFIKKVLMFFLENQPVILGKFKKDMADLRMEMRRKRTCRKIVSLSLAAQEYKEILEATLQDGMTIEDLPNIGKTKPIPSLFIKKVLMSFLENQPVIPEKLNKDMMDLRMEIRRIGNNINQAVRLAHTLKTKKTIFGRPVDFSKEFRLALNQIKLMEDKLFLFFKSYHYK